MYLSKDGDHRPLDAEVARLLQAEAVRKVTCEEEKKDEKTSVISFIFKILKSSGKVRCVFNLKTINPCVRYHKFKMEGLRTVRELLRPGDWMTSVDLQDAFHHIPLHPSHQKFF